MKRVAFLPLYATGFVWGAIDDFLGMVYRRVR